MRLISLAVLFLLFLAPIARGEESLGQVVFYVEEKSLSPEEKQESAEIEADLSHVVEGVEDYLKSHKIKYEVRRGSPISMSTLSGNRLFFGTKDFPGSTGYILIKNDGEYVIRGGLGTDIDIIMDVAEFFGIHEEQTSAL